MGCLSLLPNEIAQSIAENVAQDDILTLCCASRRLHELFLPILYRHVSVRSTDLHLVVAALTNNDRPGPQPQGHLLRTLTMTSYDASFIGYFDVIATACPLISALHFNGVPNHNNWKILVEKKRENGLVSPPTIPDEIPRPYNDALQELVPPESDTSAYSLFPSMYMAFYQTVFQHHPLLTTLTADITYTALDLPTFVQLLPRRLTWFKLGLRGQALTFTDVNLIHERCPDLVSLTFDSAGVEHADLSQPPAVTMHYTLKELSIDMVGFCHLLWYWLWFAGKKYGRQLETFRIGANGCYVKPEHHFIASTIIPCSSVFAKQHASTLKSLEIRNVGFRVELWRQMQKYTSNIKALKYSSWSTQAEIQGTGFSEMLLTNVKPTIQHLEFVLPFAKHKGADLQALVGQCHRLTCLDLSFKHNQMTSKLQLALLLNDLRQLKTLTLSSCIVHIPNYLRIGFCLTSLTLVSAEVSCTGLDTCLKSLTCLQTLNMRMCTITYDHSLLPPNKHKFPNPSLAVPRPGMSICIDDLRIQDPDLVKKNAERARKYRQYHGKAHQLMVVGGGQPSRGWTFAETWSDVPNKLNPTAVSRLPKEYMRCFNEVYTFNRLHLFLGFHFSAHTPPPDHRLIVDCDHLPRHLKIDKIAIIKNGIECHHPDESK
ncbi:hypothetical protein DM01DRAFT_1128789 [Hesseltinella vesiculosa]|uniref:F-box domain-containing protein n=1 Tax=Hesseltinella vesiculosa TaxID=101127 RepID=A0A1X2GUT3_9FUNG|nr:hypothetical protein DM01DRAFT_1128789 [Hesseltinella vesiculosa]